MKEYPIRNFASNYGTNAVKQNKCEVTRRTHASLRISLSLKLLILKGEPLRMISCTISDRENTSTWNMS